jgi:hypothetical protein
MPSLSEPVGLEEIGPLAVPLRIKIAPQCAGVGFFREPSGTNL